MSRIRNVIAVFDSFLSRREKLDQDQSMGHEFDPLCKALFGVENGMEFISDFNSLVAQVQEDVLRIQRKHYSLYSTLLVRVAVERHNGPKDSRARLA